MIELLLIMTGIVVGIMNAIAGGGMLVGFPVLLAAGLNPLAANVTANIVVLPGQLSSAFGYRSYIKKLPRRYLLLLVPCFVGGVIGAATLRATSVHDFQKFVPFLILFAVILFTFQPLLHTHLRRQIKDRSKGFSSLWVISLALLPTALYGGYFGPGFGFLMLAFLSLTSLQDFHQMNGLKNLAGVTIAAASLTVLLSTHLINWKLGLCMGLGNAIGGYIGSHFSQHFPSKVIRIAACVIGLAAAVLTAIHIY